jgi:hypothetical protein
MLFRTDVFQWGAGSFPFILEFLPFSRAMRRNIVGTEFFKNQNTAGWLPTAGQTHAPPPANNISEITNWTWYSRQVL